MIPQITMPPTDIGTRPEFKYSNPWEMQELNLDSLGCVYWFDALGDHNTPWLVISFPFEAANDALSTAYDIFS